MASLLARTGRHRQRYENNVRLVSGCIPYRLTKGNEEHSTETIIVKTIEVLMVSSPNRTDLVFPKGGWENDETVQQAACREALEEAGVRGILRDVPLGEWEFRSKSSQDLHNLQEGGCKGYMFALQVTEELDTWPEQENRGRKWLSVGDAYEFCRYEWMRQALDKFLRFMEEDEKPEKQGGEMEPSSTLVPDVTTDCAIMSSSCGANPPNDQYYHRFRNLFSFSWKIPIKRYPLT